jgi:hypothetical protein
VFEIDKIFASFFVFCKANPVNYKLAFFFFIFTGFDKAHTISFSRIVAFYRKRRYERREKQKKKTHAVKRKKFLFLFFESESCFMVKKSGEVKKLLNLPQFPRCFIASSCVKKFIKRVQTKIDSLSAPF